MDDFNSDVVAAEIRAAFDRYEAALIANDVAALVSFFRPDAQAIRMMNDRGLYGIDEIAAFRKGRDASDVARRLLRVEIRVLAADIGVASAEYRRLGSGLHGAQTQVWQRGADGWRIAAAHVSLGS
ncbi:MAG TPA: AtzH-like domain-containing protein [Paenirhodobacter sp.]